MNKLSCIPKIRISEVEVDIVCAYYGLPEEVSKYIRRLAFSNHLPFTMPTTIYAWKFRGSYQFPNGCLWIINNSLSKGIWVDKGRRNSIRNAVKSICNNKPVITTYDVCDMDNFDKELPRGKLRTEVRDHMVTIDAIFSQRASIDPHAGHGPTRFNPPTIRPYKRLTRSTWQ